MENNPQSGELQVPPAALRDEKAFEILRVWAASGEQHVVIRSDLNGGPCDFGYLLAQLLQHGVNLYSQKLGISEVECKKETLSGFIDESSDPIGEATGAIPTE